MKNHYCYIAKIAERVKTSCVHYLRYTIRYFLLMSRVNKEDFCARKIFNCHIMNIAPNDIFQVENTKERIEFINSVGFVVDNRLQLHSKNGTAIDLSLMTRIELIKFTNWVYNILFALCAASFIYFLYLKGYTRLENIFLCFFIIIFIASAIIYKKCNYVLHIKKQNFEYEEWPVDNSGKKDAKKLVAYINKRIRKKRSLMKISTSI